MHTENTDQKLALSHDRVALLNQLEELGEQLCGSVPPGHVAYVSKPNAGRACKRIAGRLRHMPGSARIWCGTEPAGLEVSELYLGPQDLELLKRYLAEHRQYEANVCVSVLLSSGLNTWAAGQYRLAAAEAAVEAK